MPSSAPRRRGRPWGPLAGDSQEINQLATLLRQLVSAAGMSLSDLTAQLAPLYVAAKREPPRATSISQRLSGKNLQNASVLIDAVIVVCVPGEQRSAVERRARELLDAAIHHPTPNAPSDAADSRTSQLAELSGLHEKYLQLLRENAELAEAKHRAELEVLRLSNLAPAVAPASPAQAPEAVVQQAPPAGKRPDVPLPRAASADPELEQVAAALSGLEGGVQRIGKALRGAIDSVIDGPRTGRFGIAQLHKTEKVYLSQRVKIELRHELGLAAGKQLDFSIEGVEAEFRFTAARNWLLSSYLTGRLILLMLADEHASVFDLGLLRLTEQCLNVGMNADRKRTLSLAGRRQIRWLFRSVPLPPNILLHLPPTDVGAVMSMRLGQHRINEFFRRVQAVPVSLAVLQTVCQQMDAPKRVRDARRQLQDEGIAVFDAHQNRELRTFGLPELALDEYLSARLVSTTGYDWALAGPDDPVMSVAEFWRSWENPFGPRPA